MFPAWDPCLQIGFWQDQGCESPINLPVHAPITETEEESVAAESRRTVEL